MLEKLNHPITKFLIRFGVLYISWFLFYDILLRYPVEPSENEELKLEQTSVLDEWVVLQTAVTSKIILESLGYDVFLNGNRHLGVVGSDGLWIGDSCNAVTLIALFAGMIIAFSGDWRKKIIFILAGAISIWLLNVFRMVFLALFNVHSKALTEFNHTYTFTIFMYAYIIFLWYWWIKKYADSNLLKDGKKN